ncbi:MAG: NAD-dependent epimerase/dehydratase family protein [Thermotogae bacterium]|nr:NAD-dependent epimerase/dehydratase family protein [Thermotogota bacterium]
MNVLVTGGAGFIGSHVVDALIGSNIIPIVVDDLSTGKIENLDPKALFYQQDIADEYMMEMVFKAHRPTYVFHLAAQISVSESVKDPKFDAHVNILGSLNILKMCVEYGVKRIIFSSTGGALYGDDVEIIPTPETTFPKPMSPYGIAKFSVENYLRFFAHQYGLEYVSLRYGNVYGPKQDPHGEAGVVAIFSERMLRNDEVHIFGDGENVRDYVYVEDVAEANLKAMEAPANIALNVGTGVGTTVNELFKKLAQLTDYQRDPVYDPPRPGDLRKSVLDTSLAERMMGWKAKYNLEEGLKKTVEFFRERLQADN